MELLKAIKNRRSIYAISKESPISEERIIEIVEFATKYTPSAYNSQSQAVYLLLGENHDKLWDITMETLRKIVPSDKFGDTEEKINSFKGGYGTVLFLNNDTTTKSLQENFPLYADKFPVWAEQQSGMLQFAVWNMLEAEGVGASLQHYNPLIDNEVKAVFQIPEELRLIAQMPFGLPTAQPDAKEFADIHTRVKIINAATSNVDEIVCSSEFTKGCI